MTAEIIQILQDWGYCIFGVAITLKMLSKTITRFKK